jgi:hypothetical protein
MPLAMIPKTEDQDLPAFYKLVHQLRRNDFCGRLIAIDPGETTGVTIIDCTPTNIHLFAQLQIGSWPLEKSLNDFVALFATTKPSQMVYESYHIYKWRLAEHTFSEVPTLQIIGVLKAIAILESVPYTSQTAQAGKAFFTDKRLKDLKLYFEGAPHARDSLRHALQYIAFGEPTKNL